MTRIRPITCLLPASLLTLFVACTSAPPAKPGPPEVPGQMSSADWEQDMQRFEAEDSKAAPLGGGLLFIGSPSIRFWETLAADFQRVAVINRGFGGSEIRDSTW